MKGLELSRRYFQEVGIEYLQAGCPELYERMAIGLAGEGSECFGFDDEFSRDHDWGPSFCIWLNKEDYEKYGLQVQKVYESMPGDYLGYPSRSHTETARNRVGCLSIPQWMMQYTGTLAGPQNLNQWRRIPEYFLATVTNGEIFHDPANTFTKIRKDMEYYPEDIRLKKIGKRAAIMAQAGQYNYNRCVNRLEMVAASLALNEFVKAAMEMTYLLNKRYAPYYKWIHHGMDSFEHLPQMKRKISLICASKDRRVTQDLIEEICVDIIEELSRQNITSHKDHYLLNHCPYIMDKIKDENLRKSHVMAD